MPTETHPSPGLQSVAENIWTLTFPLPVLGNDHGRVVTVIRLASGKLVIHSTAPFSAADVTAISALGEPGWLLDANLLHDTYVKEGRAAFPAIPYLAPPGFGKGSIEHENLLPAPPEWHEEIEVAPVQGMPVLGEVVFLHRPSQTLIVGDLVFNFDEEETTYEWLLHHFAMGLKAHPDVNRLITAMVSDKESFATSLENIMSWDFDRLIIGHKRMIDHDAKGRLREALLRTFPYLKI